MEKYDYISEQQKDSLQKTKMDINFNPESHREGLATYFRMYLQGFLNDWIKENPKPAMEEGYVIPGIFILMDLKIYTTIDSRMQDNAEGRCRSTYETASGRIFSSKHPRK